MRSGSWGLKDPRLCYLFGFYKQIMKDAKVVLCSRSRGKVVESWIRNYGGNAVRVSQEVARREELLEGIEEDLYLDFNEQRSDEWIKGKLLSIGIGWKVMTDAGD